MSLETSAIFCLPLLFKTDPESDVNYSPGFRWLLFSQHTSWGGYYLCLLHPRPLLFTVLQAAPWLWGPEMGASPWHTTSTTWVAPLLPQWSFVASRCWNQVVKGSQKAQGSWWENTGSPEETARSYLPF